MDEELQINRRILVIDDNGSIHNDFRKILCQDERLNPQLEADEASLFGKKPKKGKEKYFFEVHSAYQGKEGVEMVQKALKNQHPYAMAFVDIRMPPGWDGVETLIKLWQQDPQLQVVLCTAFADYTWEEMANKLGHSDNFVILKKPFDTMEVRQLAHALTRKWYLAQQEKHRMDVLHNMVQQRTAELESSNQNLQKEIAVRQQAEIAARLSEERFSKAFDSSPIPMAILKRKNNRNIDVNQSFVDMTGYQKDQIIDRTPDDLLLWQQSDTWHKILLMIQNTSSVRNFECQIRIASGEIRDTLVFVEVFNLANEPHLLVIIQDITERLQLEMQLRQQNKMQAIGQLSAGIAHDFNNLLTIIQGHASMYLIPDQGDHDVYESMKEIAIAADKAAQLTRQLLAFSRKQIMQRGPLDLFELVSTMSKMIQRLIGENIKFELELNHDLPPVFADANQIEQVIMNLTINARDAMPKSGTLIFRAKTVTIDNTSQMVGYDTKPGQFVCFSVTDTGTGIDPKIQPRIFEPFFTTKDIGKGSGMGLAMADGIIKQHGGWINVNSQLNQGSTFEVFLPVCEDFDVGETDECNNDSLCVKQNHAILFVEDEPGLLKIAQLVLTRKGYQVFLARNGCEALDIWKEHHNEIDLLITDMVMPEGITGKELARKLKSENKQLKVLYTSGYTNEILDQEHSSGFYTFLAKPYKARQLLETINHCLNPEQKDPPSKYLENP